MRNRFHCNEVLLICFWVGCFLNVVLGQEERVFWRTLSANLTCGRYQSYDGGHGTRIFKAMNADVVCIQEFNIGDNTPKTIQTWVEKTFGKEFTYYREEDSHIPNGVISRFPILKSGEWPDLYAPDRDFAWACLQLPETKIPLWVISVHLLSSGEKRRQKQATLLKEYIEKYIPESDYLILAGDFNTKQRRESAVLELSSHLITKGPYPSDQQGNENTNARRNRPYDWILNDIDLAPYQVPTQIGSQQFPYGLIFDSREFQPIHLVSPVQKKDSGVEGMQHMAVVKDFAVPKQKEQKSFEKLKKQSRKTKSFPQ